MGLTESSIVRWGVAFAGSIGLHVMVILVLVATGTSSEPPPPLVPSPMEQQPEPPPEAPSSPAETAQQRPAESPAPAEPAPPRPSRTGARQPSRPSPAPAAAPSDAVKTRSYTVRPGDNLTHLARNCGSTPAEIARLNGMDVKTMANLKVGQTIKLKASE